MTGTSRRMMARKSCRRRGRAQNRCMKCGGNLNRDPARSSRQYGIGDTCLCKTGCTECAAIAPVARPPTRIGVVAAVSKTVVEAECDTGADDLGLVERLKRCVHSKARSLHTFCGRERGQVL